MRWSLILQEYSFEIMHCKAPENTFADFFSRNIDDKTDEIEPHERMISEIQKMMLRYYDVNELEIGTIINQISRDPNLKKQFKKPNEFQNKDEELSEIIEKVKNNKIVESFVVSENILFQKCTMSGYSRLLYQDA